MHRRQRPNPLARVRVATHRPKLKPRTSQNPNTQVPIAPLIRRSKPSIVVSKKFKMCIMRQSIVILEKPKLSGLNSETTPNCPDEEYNDWGLQEIMFHSPPSKRRKRTLGMQQRKNRQSKKRTYKKTPYLGVSWNSQHCKWIAQIGLNRKRHYVGQFDDPRLAAEAIDRRCIELNIPPRNDTIPTPDYMLERMEREKSLMKTKKRPCSPRFKEECDESYHTKSDFSCAFESKRSYETRLRSKRSSLDFIYAY